MSEEEKKAFGLLLVVSDRRLRNELDALFKHEYRILFAENGLEGMALLKREPIEMIIASVEIPLMDGYKLCEELKSNIFTAHTPIVLLTTRNSVRSSLNCLEAGADDYVIWPSDGRLLQLKMRNMIHSRRLVHRLLKPNGSTGLGVFHWSDEVLISRVTSCIEQNLSNSSYTAHDLGRDLGLSRMQLYRKLKQATGQSANEFIRSVRLRHAALMIRDQRHTIAEVTYGVGFTDLTYFRNCFKKMFGVNPSEYHQQTSQCLTFGHYQSRLA